ncbi:Chlorophyll a-b binding protein CP24 [Hibiscus syriacus]|uniref:Chlorophyll a-b binding protein, chloroplastic n=1 Tax=Hibiscus syriacus TaxID=106335 RepID=A0A6A2YEK2_HIBSY|nr:Chlorophyll a-b binding protein CP24 [Hibiscus syriacus]
MAATSGAVLNGLCSSFLSGGKRSQALLGEKSPPPLPVELGSLSLWQPSPQLKSLGFPPSKAPGDYGFDPLGLGKDPAFLKWYRETELIHGRWAMAAVLGIFIGQAWSGIPWFEAGADPDTIAPFSFGSLLGNQLILMGWTAENFANATGEQGYPGGKFFDPLGIAGTIQNGVYVPDYDKLRDLSLLRLSMRELRCWPC